MTEKDAAESFLPGVRFSHKYDDLTDFQQLSDLPGLHPLAAAAPQTPCSIVGSLAHRSPPAKAALARRRAVGISTEPELGIAAPAEPREVLLRLKEELGVGCGENGEVFGVQELVSFAT